MTVLEDGSLLFEEQYGDLSIEPIDDDRIGPASYDVLLGDEFIRFRPKSSMMTRPDKTIIDLDEGISSLPDWAYDKFKADSIVISPGEMVLGTTVEWFSMPDNLVGTVEPRSSAARNSLATDGFIDPGFEGRVTLELANVGRVPVKAHAGSSYAQIVFHETKWGSKRPYGSGENNKYQGQSGVTGARPEP